jgi:serine/threonine protein kinase
VNFSQGSKSIREHSRAVLPSRSPVHELFAEFPADEPFDAQSILDAHPELSAQKSAVLDVVYEEFCRRIEQGESVEPRQFAGRFPAINRSLLRLIEVHQLLHAGHASLLDTNVGWPVAGDLWLDFELLEELGRGAFSRVYLARDKALGNRFVVIKATPLGPQEADTLGRLAHLHVVPVHSVVRDDRLGLTAVCMPFLSRVSLFDVIEELFSTPQAPSRAVAILKSVRSLNSSRASQFAEDDSGSEWHSRWTYLDGVLSIGVQLTEALGHAHRLGVLHCDVKPSNILVTNRGRAILIDFNLSRSSDGALQIVGGTLPYMAPEQLRALASPEKECPEVIDCRTDIFSLGATLFELVYGRSPFGELPIHESRSFVAEELLERQRRGAIAFLSPQTAGTDRRVDAIIARCLEFEAARRPQSMYELRQLFVDQLNTTHRARRWFGSHRKLTGFAISAVSAVGLLIGSWLSTRESFPMREFRKGQRAYELRDHAAAVRHLSSALEAEPHLAGVQMLRGCARFRQDDFVGAYADFEPLSKAVPDGRAMTGLAQTIAVMRADFGRAAVLYRQAVEQGYQSAIAYNNLGYCFAKDGRLREAAAALQTATTIDPNLSASYHNLGRVEMLLALQQRRPPDTEAIENALRLGPETAEIDLDAASIYAVCARSLSKEQEHNPALDRCFVLLERAVNRGIAPPHLKAISSLNKSLKSDVRWQNLEARVELGRPVERAELLLDPLPELVASVAAVPTAVAKR